MLKVLTVASHLFPLLASHALLDHEGVHIDVGCEAATIRWIAQTVVLKVLLNFESLLLLNKYFVETLDFTAFQIKFLFDGFDARLIFLK